MMDFKFTDYITRNNLIHVGTGFLSFCVGFIIKEDGVKSYHEGLFG